MWATHQRLAELWFKHSYGEGLTDEEDSELKHCLDANMRKGQRLADLYNLSYVASTINDTDWQHEVCAKIDKVEESMSS